MCLIQLPGNEGIFIAVGGFLDNSFRIFSQTLDNHKKPSVFIKHFKPVTMLMYSPGHKSLVVSSEDFRLSLWDVSTRKELQVEMRERMYIYCHT